MTLRRQWPPSGVRSFLEIFALCGFAVAQPVLDVMGRSPEFFLFRQADARQIVLLAITITLVPAAVLWASETASGLLGADARRGVSLLIRGGLLAMIALDVLVSHTTFRGPILLLAGIVIGVAGVVLLVRRRALRLWVRFLTPAPLVFAVLFLGFSPVSDLVRGRNAAIASATVGRPDTPVVVLFVDELPLSSLLDSRGQIDGRLYPNFARLADGSTWFRNTTAAATYTPLALPAMLSGRSPQKPLAPTADHFPNSLFTLLGRSHDLVSYETVTALCPPRMCQTGEVAVGGGQVLLMDAARVLAGVMSPSQGRGSVMNSLHEETIEQRRNRYGGAGAIARPQSAEDTTFRFGWLNENQPARFSDFVAALDAGPRASFWFLHLLLPHTPFQYLPSGLRYEDRWFQGNSKEPDTWPEQPWPAMLAEQRHLLQAVYTDALVGQVLDRLQATGLYDRSLLVVAADHGISFVPGEHRRRVEGDPAHVGWVPFFVKAPNQLTGKVSDANVQTIDVVPTVADLLQTDVPWPTDGLSAVAPLRRPDGSRQLHDGEKSVTLSGDQWFPEVLRSTPERVARPELGPQGLFAVGQFADLVGSRVEDDANAESAGVQATVDGLEAYGAVDYDSGVVPALVSGQIEDASGADGPLSVAVAVNGTIGGVSEVFEEGEITHKFAAMVSDSLFMPGENRLQLYLVHTGEAGPTLSPIEVRG